MIRPPHHLTSQPATRETVDKLFDASDVDKSGTIDEEEFTKIMVLTCGSIASRIVLYLALLLFLSPVLAKIIVTILAYTIGSSAIVQFLIHAIRDPLTKVAVLNNLVNWDTLLESIFGKVVFMVAFPIVFGAIDSFHQAAAEGEMLAAALSSNKKKTE